MSTPIDFSAYVMHNLKIDNLTQQHLVGPAFNLLKGTCKSLVELDYHLEEYRGRQVVHANYFFNNDIEYLKGRSSSRKYITSITKTKAAKYDNIEGIKDMVLMLWSPVTYDKHVAWGTSHWDHKLYKFKEGDFPRLNLHDIEDMLLLLVQKKLSNLKRDDLFDLGVALRMFTRRIIILHRVEDLQLGVKSYQKKLNITKPDTYRSDISKRTPYAAYNNPQGVIYLDKFKRNRLTHSDELYKFCDVTLLSVRTVLYDIASNLRMDCLSKRKWINLDRQRSCIMIKAIDKLQFERRLIRNLEKFSDTKVFIMTMEILPEPTSNKLCGRKCMTRSSTKELFTPFKDPEREFRSSRKLFKTLSLDESRSPEFKLFSDLEENSEEEVTKTMAETMEEYTRKTRANYGSGIARPKINDKDHFELKGQFLKELRDNTFSGSDHEDANEHIEKVLEIVDLFHTPNAKFLSKYFPPARTAKNMEEINNFQQEPDETRYQAWGRFKELLMKCPQHYLTEMQEVILFYNGLEVSTRQILDSKGALPTKTTANAKVGIQEMAEYSQKWHNGTSKTRSTETSDGLAAIQAQLNNLGREIKKVNEKVYAAQVRCEQPFHVSTQMRKYHGRSTFANPKYLKKAQSDKPRLYEIPYDTSDPVNRFCPNGEDTVTLEKESRSKLDKTRVIHTTSVSRPQLKSYQVKEKVVPNISQVKFTKKVVEDHHRISSISKKTKSVTACNVVHIEGEHRKQKPFLKSNDLRCPTCKKYLFSANHDECVLGYLSKLNPRASAQNKDAKSHKTTKRYMPVEKTRESKRPERQIPSGHRFSKKKTTTVPEKKMTPRSCLRWKQTGKIFKTVGLRWVPTGKTFVSSTTKVDSEPPNGSNADITNQCKSEQALNVNAGTLLSTGTSFNPIKEGLRIWLRKRQISQKTRLQGILI
ncbi:reverse transcriptase domain-containing protein [Tanacetum coccineum]